MSGRAYYANTIVGFKNDSHAVVFSALCGDKRFPTNSETKKSWSEEVNILHAEIPEGMTGEILLEYQADW